MIILSVLQGMHFTFPIMTYDDIDDLKMSKYQSFLDFSFDGNVTCAFATRLLS
jgi:hypothetical protein